MILEDREKLLSVLNNSLKERFLSNNLKIEIVPKNWDNYYRDPHFNRSIPLMLDILDLNPSANNFKIFYLPTIDFHHVQFDYNEDTWIVQWYKIESLYRKSDKKHLYVGRGEIAYLDRHSKSFYWGESKLFNPFLHDNDKARKILLQEI